MKKIRIHIHLKLIAHMWLDGYHLASYLDATPFKIQRATPRPETASARRSSSPFDIISLKSCSDGILGTSAEGTSEATWEEDTD